MARFAQISLEKRSQIVILHKTGHSQRSIAKLVNVSRFGVSTTLKRHKETGSYADRKRSGRPKKTTPATDRLIQLMSKRERFKTLPNIRAEINESLPVTISDSTVKRRLHNVGLFGRVAVKKPLLRKQNKQKRLKWAKEHMSWTTEQWQQVLWSDESPFQIFGSKRAAYCRRKVGEKFKAECIMPTVKHGGGVVQVWGCFSYDGVGSLTKIDGILKKESYHQILQHHAIPSGTKLIGRGFMFQHDNDPKHTSRLCRKYLESKEKTGVLKIMEWPAQSPDINPIEKLWDELDRQVKKLRPTNKSDLWLKLRQVWDGLQPEILQKLVNRMPKICKAIIKARGSHFDENRLN